MFSVWVCDLSFFSRDPPTSFSWALLASSFSSLWLESPLLHLRVCPWLSRTAFAAIWPDLALLSDHHPLCLTLIVFEDFRYWVVLLLIVHLWGVNHRWICSRNHLANPLHTYPAASITKLAVHQVSFSSSGSTPSMDHKPNHHHHLSLGLVADQMEDLSL